MNYQEKETQEQQVDSFETYLFVNDNGSWAYTSYNEDVTVGGSTFQTVPISRSGFSKDLENGIVKCIISAPITTIFAQYVAAFPIIPTMVQIIRYFADDTTSGVLVFNGTINSITFNKQVANAECLSSMNELNNKVPGVYIQTYCNNTLYGTVCGLNKGTYIDTVVVTLDVDDLAHMTTPGLAGVPDNFYTMGEMVFNNDSRLITKQTGLDLYIHFPFRDLISGDSVDIYEGCDMSGITCNNKFNNLSNFVGMPYVPDGKNPVEWGVD